MDDAAYQEAILTLRSSFHVRDYLAEAEGGESSSSGTAAAAGATAAPWSQAGFFRRLRTYNPQTWFGKPLSAAPPRCAAHGWVNSGLDTLRCEQCMAQLTIDGGDSVPDVASPDLHGPGCLWRGQTCPPEVAQFPLATPEALLARMGRRFPRCRQLLVHHQGQLAVAVPHDLEDFLTPLQLPLEAAARRLRQEAARGGEGRDGEEDTVKEKEAAVEEADVGAAVLALHGWEATTTPQGKWTLACGLCGRKVEAARLLARRSSLSLSPGKTTGTSSSSSSGGGSQGQGQGARAGAAGGTGQGESVTFDPIEEHRYYCPWADAAAGEAGWLQAAKVVVSRCGGVGGALREGGEDWLAVGRSGSPGGGLEKDGKAPQRPDEVYKTAMTLLRTFG